MGIETGADLERQIRARTTSNLADLRAGQLVQDRDERHRQPLPAVPQVLGSVLAVGLLVVAVGVGVFAATLSARPVLSGAVGEVAQAGGPPVVPSAAAATPSRPA